MRDAAIAIIREIGVDTGGSNIQFAVHPADRPHGRDRDEPARVAQLGAGLARRPASRSPRSPPSSRSATRSTRSATTSRARRRPASSRRSTTSSPRSRASPSRSSRRPTRRLGAQMKSVGEAMAIGRTFRESLQKAHPLARDRPLRLRRQGPGARRRPRSRRSCASPTPDRLWCVGEAFRRGMTLERVHALHGDRPVVPPAHPRDHRRARRSSRTRRTPRPARSAKRAGLLRPPARRSCAGTTRGRGPRRARSRAASCPSTSGSTPAAPSSRRTRRTSTRPTRRSARPTPTTAQEGDDPRRRAEPDRAGHRVRLLLRARRAARSRRTASRRSW